MSPIVCNCPSKCEIHPRYPTVNGQRVDLILPDISTDDKLTLKSLEADALNAQLRIQHAQQQAQAAVANLNGFIGEVYERYKVSVETHILDLKTTKFVKREAK